MATRNVFGILSNLNCKDYIEKKNGLSYLSWAWAWTKVMENFPTSTYHIYEDENGRCYHTDGRTCWVKTGVTIEGVEMIEMLPVMDFRNQSIPVDKVTSMDVNKAIQRSLTKACARHGLGLYIYAGEDLPESAQIEQQAQALEQQVQDYATRLRAAKDLKELQAVWTSLPKGEAKNAVNVLKDQLKSQLK